MSKNFESVGVLFADIAGFSKLDDDEIRFFTVDVLRELGKRVVNHRRSRLIDLNTWGDAIFVTSRDVIDLARMALELRDFFLHSREIPETLMKKLRIRIALDFARVFVAKNFILSPSGKKSACFGRELTLAARIEPVTPPNVIFMTHEFAETVRVRKRDEKIMVEPFSEKLWLPKKAGRVEVSSLHWENEKVDVSWQDPLKRLEAIAPMVVDSWHVKDKLRYSDAPHHKPRHAEVTSCLKACEKDAEVRFITITGKSIIYPNLREGEELLDMSPVVAALQRGVKFRGIVLDPDCEEAAFRSLIESGPDINEGILWEDAKKIEKIPTDSIWEHLQDEVASGLILKKTQIGLSFNLWLFDDRAIIEPYHFGKLQERRSEPHMCKFSQFTVFKERDEEYKMLKAHFENLWEKSSYLWPNIHGPKTV